jgi:hypothetical protein
VPAGFPRTRAASVGVSSPRATSVITSRWPWGRVRMAATRSGSTQGSGIGVGPGSSVDQRRSHFRKNNANASDGPTVTRRPCHSTAYCDMQPARSPPRAAFGEERPRDAVRDVGRRQVAPKSKRTGPRSRPGRRAEAAALGRLVPLVPNVCSFSLSIVGTWEADAPAYLAFVNWPRCRRPSVCCRGC